MARKATTESGAGAASARGSARAALRVSPKRAEVLLPPLSPYGGGLDPDGDYDGLEFKDLDLTGQEGPGARFIDCSLDGCGLDETALGRARFVDSVLSRVRGVGTDLAGASLRDVEIVDARLGGVQLHGAVLERVLIRGGKIDYLNLRKSRLKDVVFEGCVLSEPDFGGAELIRVEFRDCVLRRADLSGVRMKDVDLRTVAELDIARGLDRLAGAVINSAQLLQLAPAFAAQIGVRVED
ncbi:pentapeptide repeat-containing protein [Streptomyces sp. NPDC088116]|uniref:pentapeptide repeat-containing protein n=1 Tax=Streptomyces sp. NPDC088116 TaxID=3365825 RepID=UPI0038164789